MLLNGLYIELFDYVIKIVGYEMAYTRSSDLRGILADSDVKEFEDIDEILQNVTDSTGSAGVGNIKLTIRLTELLRKARITLEERTRVRWVAQPIVGQQIMNIENNCAVIWIWTGTYWMETVQ